MTEPATATDTTTTTNQTTTGADDEGSTETQEQANINIVRSTLKHRNNARNEDHALGTSTTATAAATSPEHQHHRHHHLFLPVPPLLKSVAGKSSNAEADGNAGNQGDNNSTTNNNHNKPSFAHSILPMHRRTSIPDPFIQLRKSADRKVVGLKEFGISQSLKDVRKNEWLSSTRSLQGTSNPSSANPVVHVLADAPPSDIPSVIPILRNAPLLSTEQATRMTTENNTNNNNNNPQIPSATAAAPTLPPPLPHVPSKVNIAIQQAPPPDSTDTKTTTNNNNTTPFILPPPPPPPPTRTNTTTTKPRKSVEELEEKARRKALINPMELLWLGNIAALKVMGFYLITLETFITCGLTAGLTVYWYNTRGQDETFSGGGLDFVLLAFAVTSPISAAIGMAFQRREFALVNIADFRSFSYQLYMAHCLWDWPEPDSGPNGMMGREKAAVENRVDWLEHCDAVLAQLIGIGDELSRFLTLPSASRSRHRMTRKGRQEAARTMEVAYYLLESMTTQRMTRLVLYSERLKKIGLPSGEVSRVRQYERFLSDILEQLRMIKLYRTPQALRSFARIFTILLPPFYAPKFAQVATQINLAVGIAFGIITALGLTALFESLQVLEDPFTAFLALDGIDVREEFEVLHFAHLTQTRKLVFPNAPMYPAGRRGAMTHWNQPPPDKKVGMPPTQSFHPGSVAASIGKTPSVQSGLTMDDTNHQQNTTSYVPAGDDTATTVTGPSPWRITPYADTGLSIQQQLQQQHDHHQQHANHELGMELPTEITSSRESVFGDDRAADDDDDSYHNGHRQGHVRSRSFWSLEAMTGNVSSNNTIGRNTNDSNQTPPQQQAPSSNSPTPPSAAGGRAPEGDSSTTRARTRPPSTPYHRRTHTSLSAAGMIPPTSKSRLPDF